MIEYNVTSTNDCLNNNFCDTCIDHSMQGTNDVPKHSVTSFIDTCIAVGIMKSDISSLLTDEDLEMMIRIWSRKTRRIVV